MASESLKNLSSTDEDDAGCEEDQSDGRRRRFCIERKQEEEQQKQKTNLDQRKPNLRKPNLPRFRKSPELDRPTSCNAIKNQIGKTSCSAKKRFDSHLLPKDRIIPTNPSNNEKLENSSPQSPVIFINPKFVKRFLEKSLKLASLNEATNSTQSLAPTKSLLDNNDSERNSSSQTSCINFDSVPTSSSVSAIMIEDTDFKTKPKESLRAASTMAIIRLVTESIEDTRKRDEKLNKNLVSQLIDKLVNDVKIDSSSTEICPANQSHKSNIRGHHQNIEISPKEDVSERTINSGGQPIPVIGGSVNQHFNKTSMNRTYYSPQRHNPYQRPQQIGNDGNIRSNEMQNKVKNVSTQ